MLVGRGVFAERLLGGWWVWGMRDEGDADEGGGLVKGDEGG